MNLLLLWAWWATAAEPLQPELPTDTVIVVPAEFVPALEPWLAYRHAQGHRFVHIGQLGSADDIREQIVALAQRKKTLKHVVLVGDAAHATHPGRAVPTFLSKAVVNVKYGSAPEIASDNPYGDLDGDQLPDLSVGRLPADSPEELSLLVRKILAYEKLADHGPWRQRVNLVAGVGGFGGLVDSVLEMSTKHFLCKGIPSSYATTMTYGSWRSPYCPDPRLFQAVTRQRLEEGCLFWVYLGHGQQRELDRLVVPGAALPILADDDVKKLKLQPHWPIAVLLACHCGAFDQPQDCLAEEMLRADAGPVAVYAGSRVTMPYAMAVMGNELLDECFRRGTPTLGEVVRNAKRRMATTVDEPKEGEFSNRHMLDALAAALSPEAELLQAERKEHLLLFNLLGDPLLRLHQPQNVALKWAGEATPGAALRITGAGDTAGRCILELVARRDTLRFDPPSRDTFIPSDEHLRRYQTVYQQANDPCWRRVVFDHPGGNFVQQLTIPPDCRGACHIRAFVEGDKEHAQGAVDLFVRAPPRPATSGEAKSAPIGGR